MFIIMWLKMVLNIYTTLATTTDYLILAGRLQQRLKYLNSKYNHVILLTQECLDENLNLVTKWNLNYKIISYKHFSGKSVPEYRGTLNKIDVFSLYNFNYVFNIDADVILLQNIDTKFEQCIKHLEKTKIKALFFNQPELYRYSFDSNIFICKPDLIEYNKLVQYHNQKWRDIWVDDHIFLNFYQNSVDTGIFDENDLIHLPGLIRLHNDLPENFHKILFNTKIESNQYNKLIDNNIDVFRNYRI